MIFQKKYYKFIICDYLVIFIYEISMIEKLHNLLQYLHQHYMHEQQ